MHSEASRKLMSDKKLGELHWLYGKHYSPEHSLNASVSHTRIHTPLYAYDLEGNFVGEYASPSEAKQILLKEEKGSTGDILANCRGKQMTCHGYIFQFKDNDNISTILQEYKKQKVHNTKEVFQYDTEDNLIQVHKNSYQAEKTLKEQGIKLLSTDIRKCCEGKSKTAKGYRWKYENSTQSNIKKVCLKCGIEKPLSGFPKRSKETDGHHRYCSLCVKTENEAYYQNVRKNYIRPSKKIVIPEFICELCGKEINNYQHLMYHLTKCHPLTSKYEYTSKYLPHEYGRPEGDDTFPNELLEYIKEIYPGEIQLDGDRISLPELNIGIEYNNLYWHSEKCGKTKDYHIGKFQKAQDAGIRLIQIFSDEWKLNQDICKSKLYSIVGNKAKGIPARKCIIHTIDSKAKNSFLNKHHIQGEDRSSIKLGLFYNEEMVAVMTFSNPRVPMGGNPLLKDVFELSRYASSSYIIGGTAKLLKHFILEYKPAQIYSYSDNRWTDPNNNMYLKNGFVKEGISTPNYCYTKDYISRIHRYNFNKFKLREMGFDTANRTEKDIMSELGFSKIWDCGVTKYIMQLM